jgi:hypothetical protein
MSGSIFLSVTYHSVSLFQSHHTYASSAALARATESSQRGDIFLMLVDPDDAQYAARQGAPSCAVWPTFLDKRDFKEKVISSEVDNDAEELFDSLDRRARESWKCLIKSTYKTPMCIDENGQCVIARRRSEQEF